jgi:penicillin-binding protein 2
MGLDNQSLLGFPAPADSRQNLDLIAAGYNLVNSCIGQGPVLATPLQITAMTNTIATGGMYLQPRLVKEIRGAKGLVREIRGPEPVRAISPEVASQVGDMMAGVTREGVGRRAWVDQGGAAGKTGSAEIGGESGMINAWFSGYTPLEKPRFTITVLVREGVSGAASAAPVFKEIAEGIAHRQSINPQ